MAKRKTFYKISLGLFTLLIGSYFFMDLLIEPPGLRTPASYPENYESFSACEKQNILWAEIKKSTYSILPEIRDFSLPQLIAMSRQQISLKGYFQSDFAPAGWKKFIHGRGAVAKIKFVAAPTIYTGVFGGADCGLIRLSITFKPTSEKTDFLGSVKKVFSDKAVAPGLALKILRDKVTSANVSALVSIEGQDKDYNIFRNPMSNIVPEGSGAGAKMVQRIFKKVSAYPEEIVLDDFAQIDVRGLNVNQPKSPRQVFFIPNEGLNFSSEEHDFREDVLKIPAGTKLYSVYLLSAGNNTKEYAGDIVTTSEFVASEFGDDGLFFKHQFKK